MQLFISAAAKKLTSRSSRSRRSWAGTRTSPWSRPAWGISGEKRFFTPIPCSYTSSQLDGMARNYIFNLPGYARITQFIVSGSIHSYLLCPRKEEKPFGLSWNRTQVLLCQLFTSDHSNHHIMPPQAWRKKMLTLWLVAHLHQRQD